MNKTLPEFISASVTVHYEVASIIEGLDWEEDEITLELVLEWVKEVAAEDLAECSNGYALEWEQRA